MLQHLARGLGAVLAIGHLHGRPALDDSLVEQAPGRRHGHQNADLRTTTRFAKDGDVGRIATEAGNVVTDPFEGSDDVEHAREARMLEAFGRVLHVKVAQGAEAMVERDDHDIVEPAEIGTVGPR